MKNAPLVLLSVLAVLIAGGIVFRVRKDPVNQPKAETVTSTTDSIAKSNEPEVILFDVPFTAQAPSGKWENEKQQNACEEASALMAMHWVQNKLLTQEGAEEELIAISNYELANFEHFHDTSAEDTIERIFKGYFNYQNVELKSDISVNDIRKELENENIVLVPVNGRILKNPNYIPPGPDEHMIVIIGYDFTKKEFITHDPGTRQGGKFRYSEQVLEDALKDYPSGFHESTDTIKKTMIVVKKS